FHNKHRPEREQSGIHHDEFDFRDALARRPVNQAGHKQEVSERQYEHESCTESVSRCWSGGDEYLLAHGRLGGSNRNAVTISSYSFVFAVPRRELPCPSQMITTTARGAQA